MTTRRYCMNATRRVSAPKADAMTMMAEAAPGDMPQTAVVPGSTRQRVMAQPSAVHAPMIASTTPRKSGHPFKKVPRMAGVRNRAIMQPMTAWQAWKKGRGMRMVPPQHSVVIAAIIGPRKRAAGSCRNSSPAVMINDPAASAIHWKGGVSIPSGPESLVGTCFVSGIEFPARSNRAGKDAAASARGQEAPARKR